MNDPGTIVPSPQVARPTLDDLVSYFVAAKRSLAVTSHVHLANELVEEARTLVEETAVLRAKNTHVRSGLQQQIHVLQNIYGALEVVGADVQVDFQVSLVFRAFATQVDLLLCYRR